MKAFLQNEDVALLMMIVAGVTVISTFIGALIYRGLLSEKKNKKGKGNRMKKELVRKLETYYKLHRKIYNMEHFVDHNLLEYRFMGLSLDTWNNIPLYGSAAIIMIELLGSLLGMVFGMTGMWYLRMAIVSVSLLSCLGIVEVFFGNRRKQDRLRMQLLDFLENTVLAKLELAEAPQGMKYYRKYFSDLSEEDNSQEIQEKASREKTSREKASSEKASREETSREKVSHEEISQEKLHQGILSQKKNSLYKQTFTKDFPEERPFQNKGMDQRIEFKEEEDLSAPEKVLEETAAQKENSAALLDEILKEYLS